ncbi:zinc-dependent alcohol dehydrogenase [Cryobacterium suzukii]|uniref:zinc-dependent alcohol dehydrogenase n=1 Tax=Cryobacterium suzukii TaxID=1259198 RepID=UPI001F545F6B|nr:alcohol dehydrogenase catalytic domain-containing protein [Cryobacterium suzukii]
MLIETEAVGLCGSDIHAINGHVGYEWMPERVTLGHEAVGRIVRTGANVDSACIGNRVVPMAIDGCLECETCLSGAPQLCLERDCLGLSFDGALAQYFVLDADRVFVIDNSLRASVAALIEPAAVAAHAVGQLAENLRGRRVVVSGPGAVGILSCLFAAAAGADVELVCPEAGPQTRREFAEHLGIKTIYGHHGLAAGPPVDAWIEASGAEAAFSGAVESLRRGGTLVVVALFARAPSFDVNQMVRGELRLYGTYGYTRADYSTAHELLVGWQDRLEPMVSTYHLTDVDAAISATEQASVIKAVVVPGGATKTITGSTKDDLSH